MATTRFFSSLSARLLCYVLIGALAGIGGMAFLFYQIAKDYARAEIQGALSTHVQTIATSLAEVEASTGGLAIAAKQLHNMGVTDADTYSRAALAYFRERPPLVMGLGVGQAPRRLAPDREWNWPYYYLDQGVEGGKGRPLPSPDQKIRLSELFRDDAYPTQDYYKSPVTLGHPTWVEPYDWFGVTMTSYMHPFYDADRNLLGVVGADVNWTALSQRTPSAAVPGKGYLTVISKAGNLLVYPPDPSLAQRRENAGTVPALASIWSQIRDLPDDARGASSDSRFFYVFQRVPGTCWMMLAVVPKWTVIGPVLGLALTGAIGAGSILALLVLLFIRRLNLRLQPILAECQHLVAEYAAPAAPAAPGQKISTTSALAPPQDEIDVLASSFNFMSAQLQKSFARLEAQNSELQRLDRVKDEFLANTSHELRTPLNGIIGLAESLMDGATGPLSEPTFKNLGMIVMSGRRLSNLINDILDFSKLRNHNLELNLKPVGLRESAEIVLTLSAPLVGRRPVTLENLIPAGLVAALADENRVQQIFHNVIGNAVKFTHSGSVTVTAAHDPAKKILTVTIADTGIGIPADKIGRIFESFEQGDGSTARAYGGTGLGLAVTRQLVELHGGKIWADSTPGKGSSFHFTLPAHNRPAEEKLPSGSPDPASDTTTRLPLAESPAALTPRNLPTASAIGRSHSPITIQADRPGLRVLIVDDEPINLQVLLNYLSLAEYTVTLAQGGQEALDLLDSDQQFDLVVLDVMMPGLTGYEVCAAIRQRFPAHQLPVVLLTAKNQVQDLVQGLDGGANDYLTKPVAKNELLSRIRTHIELSMINLAYERFVPRQFLEHLNRESIIDVQLGDQVQEEMSVLFSDIRSFTTLSESMTPEENFRFINAYLSRMEPPISQHGGFIDKYIGDAIMALFSGDADNSVRAGIAMLHALAEYNAHRLADGYQPIRIGIGINTGTLMLGTVGGRKRMNGTVISDAVNLASRIESLTKGYGLAMIVSEFTVAALTTPADYLLREIDTVTVKGKTRPVVMHEVFSADPEPLREAKKLTRPLFARALAHLRAGDRPAAAAFFQQCLDQAPGDTVAAIYLARCEGHSPANDDH